MPLVSFDCIECYPVYVICDDDYRLKECTMELTDAELARFNAAMLEYNEVQDMIMDKKEGGCK